jgi:subtilisin family serine protease
MVEGERGSEHERGQLPAWSRPAGTAGEMAMAADWPERITREWALGGSTGKGIKVCILDSGVEPSHPRVGPIQSAVAISLDRSGLPIAQEDRDGDLCGHGTACAGIIRSLAPECEIHSVRVLGAGYSGSGPVLLEGLRYAVEQGFDVINMSLSTTKAKFAGLLHELADTAYFKRTLIVASAHNLAVESYPWRFSSVISVGSHDGADPFTFYANPEPPVEFFARGVDVEVAWPGGSTIRATGNSFATPTMSGICTLVLGKHRGLTPFQLKSVLYLIAANVGGGE